MPDRMNDHLANDRTFLAWLRTAIACFGLGFVVAKIAMIIQVDGRSVPNKSLYSAIGVVLVLSGAALILVGGWQHRKVHRSIGEEGVDPPRWVEVTTIVSVVAALALATLIVIST